jgi:hypothetical protein
MIMNSDYLLRPGMFVSRYRNQSQGFCCCVQKYRSIAPASKTVFIIDRGVAGAEMKTGLENITDIKVTRGLAKMKSCYFRFETLSNRSK